MEEQLTWGRTERATVELPGLKGVVCGEDQPAWKWREVTCGAGDEESEMGQVTEPCRHAESSHSWPDTALRVGW